ncbi:hypothetical protein HUX88_29315 [Duganella sp. BJB1802]|uniref:hypothetical protein n=1 Tax=Duganella sp. BJB1802 TaxID=2744575 RepID=UPI0015931C02|nr:hypothetical protein [Duganella sp. BJB1802]NVD74589.1 hypothetical protein [Duganella sp. BJB1802]
MIIRRAIEANPWKRIIPVFLMVNSFTLILFFVVFDILGYEKKPLFLLFFIVLFLSVAFFLIGYFSGGPLRLKFFVLIVGAFGIIPIVLFSMAPFVLCLMSPHGSFFFRIFILLLYFLVSAIWVVFEIRWIRKIFEKTSYFENQIEVCGAVSYVDRDEIEDIYDFKEIKSNKNFYAKAISILCPFALLGYPLQKLITGIGGEFGTLFFASMLSVPLSIYFIGRLSAGYYLWVHLIGKFEKEKETKVILR